MKPPEHDALLHTLQRRFDQHPQRHAGTAWAEVLTRLREHPAAWQTLQRMEAGGHLRCRKATFCIP